MLMLAMFARKNLQDLIAWYRSKKRKPLVMRGARQVGKSTLIHSLAKHLDLHLVEINLEVVELKSLSQTTVNINNIILEIELILGRKLNPERDLIFFDEIQKSALALMSLRYFYEQRPELAVISAGSLLDFLLNDQQLSVPVGRIEFYHLGPVCFSDYLKAIGSSVLFEEYNKPLYDISEPGHHHLMEAWKTYCFIGGMPEAIASYLEDKDFTSVRKIHRNIVFTYQADFFKYAQKGQIHRCNRVFNFIPTSIGEKIKYTEIDPDEKSRDLKAAIQLLLHARVIIPCYHSNSTSVPLSATMDERIYKLYFLDGGLAAAQAEIPPELLLLGDHALQGKLTEQMIAQNLAYLDPQKEPQLYYWLQDKSSSKAEVDFVINEQDQIVPVEVKSRSRAKTRSLAVFKKTHPSSTSSVVISPQIYKKEGKKIHLPLYAIERIYEALKSAACQIEDTP